MKHTDKKKIVKKGFKIKLPLIFALAKDKMKIKSVEHKRLIFICIYMISVLYTKEKI